MKTIDFKGNFIDGRFVLPGARAERALSEDPGDLDHPVGEFVFTKDAVEDAVRAARRAFPAWSKRATKDRATFIARFREVLKSRVAPFAELISREMGKALSESRGEVERIMDKARTACQEEARLVCPTEHQVGPGLAGHLRFRPRGVLAILSPFNVPAYLACAQIIPAILHGNTVVCKPSELTPFVGQWIASLFKKSGLPKGVFNLVQGAGVVGQALVCHPEVDGVLFTGSWATGSKIQAELASKPEKLCALEMGGKNSVIVCRDADLKLAVEESVIGAFLTSGQRCNATSRVLVESAVAGKFVDRFLERVRAIKIGYSLDRDAWMGPVVSEKALQRVLDMLGRARDEGFSVLEAGGRVPKTRRGYYLKPSVHQMEGTPKAPLCDGTYTDEEVFGPDVAIYVVGNLEEALELNNRSHYGLVASVFTASRSKFEFVLRGAQNGLIHWNAATTRSSSRLPFGGLKRSGNNRPVGFFSPYVCTIPTASVERARP